MGMGCKLSEIGYEQITVYIWPFGGFCSIRHWLPSRDFISVHLGSNIQRPSSVRPTKNNVLIPLSVLDIGFVSRLDYSGCNTLPSLFAWEQLWMRCPQCKRRRRGYEFFSRITVPATVMSTEYIQLVKSERDWCHVRKPVMRERHDAEMETRQPAQFFIVSV